MNLSIVYSTQPTNFQAATFSGELEINLTKIANFGYNGVELAVRDPKLLDIDALQAIIDKLELVVPAIGTGQAWGEEGLSFTDPDPEVRQKAIDRIKSHIPVASRFNAVIIIGLIRGVIKPGDEHPQAKRWIIDALRTCCEDAGKLGVKLALEPINRYETSLINNVDQGLQLIETVGMDNFGLLLDTYHMNIEEPVIEDSIRLCGDRIFHFHVADSNRWHPGAGHLNFTSILGSLLKSDYSGFISGEFLPYPDADTSAINNIRYLSDIFN